MSRFEEKIRRMAREEAQRLDDGDLHGGGGGGGDLLSTNNLSDVSNAATSLANLGGATSGHNHTGTYQPLAAVLTNTTASFTTADETKLDGIEASADVTDTANVTSAGALMDSELTDLVGVKALDTSTIQSKPAEGAFANGDKTKLDGIETGATADQTAGEIEAIVSHDNLQGVTANEHIDWTQDQGATNIHAGNYTDTDTTDHTAFSNIGTNTHAQIDTAITNSTNHIASTSNPHSVDETDILPSQTGNSGKYLTTNGTISSWASLAGGGDMSASTYDPATISEQLVGLTASQTLTNKTINADNNTITNIGTSEISDDSVTSEKLDATVAWRATRSASGQSINNTTVTQLVFDSESFDLGSDYNTSTGAFTAPKAGYYQINAAARIDNINDQTLIIMYVYVNGALYTRQQLNTSGGVSTDHSIAINDLVFCGSGQTIEIRLWHNHGSARNVPNSDHTYFSGFLVGS